MEGEIEGQDNSQDTQGQVEVQPEETSGGTGINPAWEPVLGLVPPTLHSQITPHLSKWDQNFQAKVQEVHSQYEPYKAYQPFVENGIAPDQINYGLGLLQALEERPEEVLKAIQAYIGEEAGLAEQQGQQNLEDNGQNEPEYFQHPEFKRMQDMVNTMANLMVQQRETAVNNQLDQELDSELSEAQKELGDFDEEWVLTKMYNNPELSVKQAVEAYREFENSVVQRRQQPGPPVLGAGGSVAQQRFDPSKMSDKDRRATVAQILAQSQQNNT